MVHHQAWLPFISGRQPMKHFNAEHLPFAFDDEFVPWDSDHASVAMNCFADGGTNAHVIISDYISDSAREGASDSSQPFVATRTPLPPPPLSRVQYPLAHAASAVHVPEAEQIAEAAHVDAALVDPALVEAAHVDEQGTPSHPATNTLPNPWF